MSVTNLDVSLGEESFLSTWIGPLPPAISNAFVGHSQNVSFTEAQLSWVRLSLEIVQGAGLSRQNKKNVINRLWEGVPDNDNVKN